MVFNPMNFSVIIPTYNREKDLEKCIDSIVKQNVSPKEVLVIDDGNLNQEYVDNLKMIVERVGTNFVYHKKNHAKEPRGSCESRNLGLKLAKNEIVFILDDDIVLDDFFFEEIIKVWEENKDKNLMGVGGFIKNIRHQGKLERIYNKIFCLTSKYKWDVNEIGFQVWDQDMKQRERGYYTNGGLCSFNRELALLVNFIAFGGGRNSEDIDFCLRAKNKGYYFIMEPKAKAFHKQSVIGREKESLIGFKESYNRKIIFRDNCAKTIKNNLWFLWSTIGWIFRQFLVGHFARGLGLLKGFFTKAK